MSVLGGDKRLDTKRPRSKEWAGKDNRRREAEIDRSSEYGSAVEEGVEWGKTIVSKRFGNADGRG